MSKINKEAFFSPMGIFAIYILAAALVILGFRFIFPGEPVPLACFSVSWRFIRFVLDFLNLFPALVLSALVIPFGFKVHALEKIKPFSAEFLLSLKNSIVTAIVAAAINGLLSFLIIPLAQDYEANLRFQGRLYNLAKERAQENAEAGEWAETAQYVAVCETIWPNGPEVARLKIEAEIRLEEELLSPDTHHFDPKRTADGPASAQPVNVTEALALAEKALAEERYFDAHWLATLGGRLAKPGSVEQTSAARLAGRAWSGVNSLAPNARETQAYSIFRLKRDGYEALVAEEWIRSYYIFRELITLSPEDPDVTKYLALSESEVTKAAFFIDEIEMASGTILTGAVFSLPLGIFNESAGRSFQGAGRLVMRVTSLSAFSDSAYGIGTEILAFDQDGHPLWSMEAPYAKIVPLVLDSGPAVAVLMRALDRIDKTKHWEPVVKGFGQGAPAGVETILPVSWDNFLLLTKVRRGLTALSPKDLKTAAENLGNSGYQGQVFEAELLRRFVEPLFILPMGIFAVVLGWRYRALKRSRYMAIPMLGVLPLVFNGIVHVCRSWINNLGIWAVVSLGFSFAVIAFGIGITVLFILSLIILAAQHG